jgi:hypothetical protein
MLFIITGISCSLIGCSLQMEFRRELLENTFTSFAKELLSRVS